MNNNTEEFNNWSHFYENEDPYCEECIQEPCTLEGIVNRCVKLKTTSDSKAYHKFLNYLNPYDSNCQEGGAEDLLPCVINQALYGLENFFENPNIKDEDKEDAYFYLAEGWGNEVISGIWAFMKFVDSAPFKKVVTDDEIREECMMDEDE